MGALFLVVIGLVLFVLPNQPVEGLHEGARPEKRYVRSYQWAWFALLPAFLYGYMEASMNSNFPIYALRIGLEEH